ncbi:hypothetical protein Tcan_11936 [Toxocara canis]|uniref:Uncharacterized protein n=1 Tax=Toxocara canis TaxID=6265 RepID=A0A0B2V730_TOXCA|nr:hypothetical protein Tcan_11936 [Toxocara canis]
MSALKALNYSAFAWSINDFDELHSEYGYLTLQPGTKFASLTTVMNNGKIVREWTLLDANTLQARLDMETLTHDMQEHTFIRYNKIYP